MSGATLSRCAACGAAFFPARLLCPRCGGASWETVSVTQATVEEVTTVRRAVGHAAAEPRRLATVRLPEGQHLIVGLDQTAEPGDAVELSQSKGAVRASRAGE